MWYKYDNIGVCNGNANIIIVIKNNGGCMIYTFFQLPLSPREMGQDQGSLYNTLFFWN